MIFEIYRQLKEIADKEFDEIIEESERNVMPMDEVDSFEEKF
jgi:hypothetical protein